MIEPREIAALMKTVGAAIREHVAATFTAVILRLDDLEKRISAIPAGPKGDPGNDAEPVDTARIVADVLLQIPTPRDGKDGERGPQGESIVGPKGEQGEKGESIVGPVGPKGENGKDAEPVNVAGVIAEVLRQVPTPKDGKDGKDGIAGAPGEKGLDGKDGRDGREGKDGKDGRDGVPGRDALEIEILSGIDPAKSYPRGTFAQYRGGLIRACRNTDSMSGVLVDEVQKSGWAIILDGICDIVMTQSEDLRSIESRFLLTSGHEIRKCFSFPALIYREIYQEGAEYSRGDAVTYGGSLWHCAVESTKAKPGLSPDWKLIVKRGGEGKQGQKGEPGTPGKDGKDGRDLRAIGAYQP